MAGNAYKINVGGDWVWEVDPIRIVLVDAASYTPDLNADEFLSDIAGSARVATSPLLTGKTRVLGVVDANDVTFTAVSGASCEYVVAYVDSGSAATSRLLYLWDTTAPSPVGLPVSPNGSDIVVTWDNGPNKIVNMDAP